MATLPQGADLRKNIGTAASPGVRVGQIDYGPLAQGGKAIGDGISALGKAGAGIAAELQAKDTEVDDYETRKRLLDFRLQTEMELEQHKRAMPQGGAGYAQSWAERFKERATEFVGEKDANIPESQRGKVGLQLKSIETMLSERAQREEWAERDRTEIEGLETTLGQTRSFVEADPTRREEMLAEGRKLIDLSRISPAAKDRLSKHYGKEVDKTAIASRLMRAQTAEEFDALAKDLAPHAPERRSDPIARTGKEPASIRFNNPGAQYPGPSAAKFGSTGTEIIGGGHKIAVFDNPVNGGAAQLDLLSRSYTGKTLGTAISTWSGGNSPDAYLSVIERETGISRGTVLTREMLRRPEVAIPLARAMAKHEAGADYPMSEGQWQEAHAAFTAGRPVETSPSGDAYAGPYAGLTLSERKAFHGQLETERRKRVADLDKIVSEYMTPADAGIVPQDAELAPIRQRIEAMRDDRLIAKFNKMVRTAEAMSVYRAAPSIALDAEAKAFRAVIRDNGTKEQLEFAEKLEKMAAETRKAETSDPMTHAHNVGIVVPLADGPPADLDPGQRARWQMPTERVRLEPLNFAAPDIDAQLSRRFEQAKGMARYTGKPVLAFTEGDRSMLKSFLAQGGPGMLQVMGRIAQAAGKSGIEPEQVMKEFAKDAPEVGMIGELVANNADPTVLDTAAKALSWKVKMGEKFQQTVDPALASAALGPMADVLKSQPTKQDSVKALAALVYEYEARRDGKGADGKLSFNPSAYQSVVNRLMGETKDATGQTYGGIGEQGASGLFSPSTWFDGKSASKVLVPAGVRTDSFDTLVSSLRANDLVMTGVPRDTAGEPLTMAEVRRAQWISVGHGKYVLKMGERADGRAITARNDGGGELVLDIRPALDNIRKRQPDIFLGYDPMSDAAKTEADPALPSWFTTPRGSPAAAPAEPIDTMPDMTGAIP